MRKKKKRKDPVHRMSDRSQREDTVEGAWRESHDYTADPKVKVGENTKKEPYREHAPWEQRESLNQKAREEIEKNLHADDLTEAARKLVVHTTHVAGPDT